MVQSFLWQMVRTRSTKEQLVDIAESSTGCGQAPHEQAPHGNAPLPPPPCPPVSLEQLLATQNELMRMLVENDACRGAGH
jgi:hypothetical protein